MVRLSGYQTSQDNQRSAGVQIASPAWNARIISRLVMLWARMRRAQNIRRTITTLESLDDRTLKDIGMHRCQIQSVVTHRDRHQW